MGGNRDCGPGAAHLFSSKGLFIETMVKVPSWGCWGLKVLANGINYSPEEWRGREEEQFV